jgi:tRNA modification GTPase
MEGEFSERIRSIRQLVLEARGLFEAGLDFADEKDVGEGVLEQGRRAMLAADVEIRALIAGSAARRQIVEGFKIVIAGPPNAGKSSLLNALARRELAITSPIAGTTRDSIEVRLDIGGFLVVAVDTAGLRISDDPIELAGISRTRTHLASADLVLWLSDSGEPLDSDVEESKTLRVRTKSDLRDSTGDGIPVSVVVADGCDRLLGEIERRLSLLGSADSAPVVRERHRNALISASGFLSSALREDACTHDEVLAEHLRRASDELGRIVGEVGSEELLGEIFGKFCIGK